MTKDLGITDEKLVELVRKKDKELYSLIINRYQDRLLRYANYLIGDEDIASDIVQESFIDAYKNLNGFNTKKKFSSWIYRIVHNNSMTILKKRGKTLPLDTDIDFDSGINIEDDLVKKELVLHTRECLNKMDLIYKEPISLYYLEDKSYIEISDILRIPEGTVATRINRGKAIMKKICARKI